MNITTKKLIIIITALLTGMVFMASCSKEPEAKTGKKEKKASVAAKAKSIPPDEGNTLKAVRNGQIVKLNWHVDKAGGNIKQVNIFRSLTDMKNKQEKVAKLAPGTVNYEDRLPDKNAYWYTVKLLMEDGKFQQIGPVRVDMDKAVSADYDKQEDKYKASITRTDDFATLKWDFPEGEYAGIKIIRSSIPLTEPFKKARQTTAVITTTEGKSQCVNALKDPNSEYWYWFRITLKSGVVIDKGPIKAEYAGK